MLLMSLIMESEREALPSADSSEDVQVTKRYIKFDEAADCLCGRILAGLNLQSPEFMTLPPHFTEVNQFVQSQVLQMFGNINHPKLLNVAPFLLASIVYHYDWLISTMPANHPFWKSGINDIMINQLKNLVTINKSDAIVPRGVPIGPVLIERLNNQEALLKDLNEKVTSGFNQIQSEQSKLSELIPLSAAASGMMCGTGQLLSLRQALSEEISNGFSRLNANSADVSNAELPSNVNDTGEDGYPMYMWGGKFRFISETYIQDLDQCQQITLLWKRWWCGSVHEESRTRPLKLILRSYRDDLISAYAKKLGNDFDAKKKKNLQKQLSEISFVLSWLERIYEDNAEKTLDTLSPLNNSLELAKEVSECWKAIWPVAEERLSSFPRARKDQNPARKRRKHDLSTCGYRTIYEKIREFQKHNSST